MTAVVRPAKPRPAGVEGAIVRLYDVFAGYRYRASMPACAHCVSDEDLLALGSQPLDRLPAPLLGRYTIKAVSTWGEVSDLKWLLPRLAQLLARGQLPVPAGALTAKLTRADWHAWPTAEREAVRALLHEWWLEGLRSTPDIGAVVTARLPAVAAAEPDLTQYLLAWQEALAGDDARRLAALQHVLELVCHSRFRPDLPSSLAALFWEPAGPAAAQTAAWLTSPDLAGEIDRALYDLAANPDARRLAVAAARLRRYRALVA
jgi:hypothetical protein